MILMQFVHDGRQETKPQFSRGLIIVLHLDVFRRQPWCSYTSYGLIMFHDVFTDPGVNNLFYVFRQKANIRYWTVGARVVRVERLLFRCGRMIARLQRIGS